MGSLHGSVVEVEHAYGPDPYDLHPAFGNLELAKWGSDWQDGTAAFGANQTES